MPYPSKLIEDIQAEALKSAKTSSIAADGQQAPWLTIVLLCEMVKRMPAPPAAPLASEPRVTDVPMVVERLRTISEAMRGLDYVISATYGGEGPQRTAFLKCAEANEELIESTGSREALLKDLQP